MFIILIGIYIFFLAFLWGIFILTKIMSYKYKEIYSDIEKYTKFFFVLLVVLNIVGLSIIYVLYNKQTVKTVDENNVIESVYY
ncbi:MAG: hypothetical protein PHE25_03535 [Candidatus Gracilibacteria bacterium]|nr:hypothetical protein [Candidatus Gracilibacteria bacterium]